MNSSMLWIFLIVAWLFILLPMVLRGRPEVRKTTEAAASTRVLHRGGERAAVRRRAAGRHPSDPEYVRKRTEPVLAKADLEETVVPESIPDLEDDLAAGRTSEAEATDVLAVVDADELDADESAGEPLDDELDGADEVAGDEVDADEVDAAELDAAEFDAADDEADAEDDLDADDFDAVDDVDAVDGFDVLDDLDEGKAPVRGKPRELRGRGSYPPEVLAEREARRYAERRRIVTGLLVATALAIASCFYFAPYGYIATGTMVVLSGLYLFFLRRTALAEQHFRAQRAARLRRHAAEDERLRRQREGAIPVRPAAPGLRRPGGMVVVDLDDEDPAFHHLPVYDFAHAGAGEPLDDEYRRAV